MTILDKIAKNRLKIVESAKNTAPIEQLKEMAGKSPCAIDVIARLKNWPLKKRAIIAEIKRQSPSKGPLWINLDPAALAKTYEKAGAFAISVLTEPDYFMGNVSDLTAARKVVDVPLLYKDFIISPYQLWEARAAGADMALLIVALLKEQTADFICLAKEAGLEPLIEVHDGQELDTAINAGAKLVGINNRNLKTFEVNISTTRELLPKIPADVFAISESGLKSAADLDLLSQEGAKAFLIGESLVKSNNPGLTLASLVDGAP